MRRAIVRSRVCAVLTLAAAAVALPADAGVRTSLSPRTVRREIARIEAARPESRRALVERLAARLGSTPVIEGRRALFIWRGDAATVRLVGDMNGWDREGAPLLSRIEGTDLWWIERRFERDARLDYKFVADGETWLLDPSNPRTCVGGFGPNSVLVMPDYAAPPEVEEAETGEPEGTLETLDIESGVFGRRRRVDVYVPSGVGDTRGVPSVTFLDGGDYLTLARAPRILDILVARGDLPPLVAVFVPPIRRYEEYARDETHVRFLADEVVPLVRERWSVSTSPERTVVIGPSMGGLAAVHTALARPEVFGVALGQSGAYALDDDSLIRDVRERPKRGVRFHLVAGSYETRVGGGEREGNLIEAQRRLVRALKRGGYEVEAVEVPEGHSWGLWNAWIGRGLAFALLPDGG